MSTFVETVLGGPAGSVVTAEPDYIVINDGVSHAAVDEISAVAAPEKVFVIYDHDVPAGSPEAAGILRKNLGFADQYGCPYIQAKGAGYQYMLNEIVKPGQIVVGAGSHGSIFGAAGALGLNLSIPELARAVETGRYSTIVPETIRVRVNGKLSDGVSIMDAALAFLKDRQDLGGRAVEFICPTLTEHEKAVLCSMACMTGACTASAAGESGTQTPQSIPAAELDLSSIRPMLMLPCRLRSDQSRAEICERSRLEGAVLQAGQIGGYTGGTIEELRKAAALIEGKTLALGFRLTVCPATSRDYIEAMEEGVLTKFIDYGAQIGAAGDHSVVAQGAGAMGPGESLITTGLYTFSGAMGCEDAKIYTASVESVIAASTSKQI